MKLASPSSSPASPTGEEDLLYELRTFLSTISSSHVVQNPRIQNRMAQKALHLLHYLPAARDGVLQFYSSIFDSAVARHFESTKVGVEEEAMIAELQETLASFIRSNSEAWAPIISKWSLGLLGELSSKYSAKVSKSPHSSGITDTLPVWLNCPGTRTLIELTAQCLTCLKDTESCVSALLDTSVQHSPHFDWVVAHIGGCFPTTIITRVLSVGLKDFSYHSTKQIGGDGTVNLAKVPKINSVVGILGHLAGTHEADIRSSLQTMILDSLQSHVNPSSHHIACIPYLLHMASLSEMLSAALTDDAAAILSRDSVVQIQTYVPQWTKKYFPGPDSLVDLIVHLLIGCGSSGADLLCFLLDTAADKDGGLSREISDAAKLIVDLLLADLFNLVQQSSRIKTDHIPILASVGQHLQRFLDTYLLSSDGFQQKSVGTLLHLLSLHKGRTVAIQTIKHFLNRSECDEHLAAMFNFIRITEPWIAGVLSGAVRQCIISKVNPPLPFLDNLIGALEFEHSDNKQKNIDVVSRFSNCLKGHHERLLALLNRRELVPRVLRIFQLVPLPSRELTVTLMHKATHCFVHTMFLTLKDASLSTEKKLETVFACGDVLAQVVAHSSAGLTMVLRFLLEATISDQFAEAFGGRTPETRHASTLDTKLFDENLSFGSMPSHPSGTLTLFHAGVIGDGPRRGSGQPKLPVSVAEFNRLTLVHVLFKLCTSKEAFRQLALLMVDLVSPDVMFNGLPWPEEEFSKVTIERDLKIGKTLDDHPILWSILLGLADAKPALCYCSVLLRAVMAVQMSFWQSCIARRAADSPKQLEVTRRVLSLMSIGQFLPHPLNGVGDVIGVLQPFHVYCILVDVWNFMRDNVPSPVSFATTSTGDLRRDFEAYKNYKQYCERLRLIMLKHVAKLSKEFKRFFVDVANQQDESMKIAMEY